MARKSYPDEDVLRLWREIELSLASGNAVATACRSSGERCTLQQLAQKVWGNGHITAFGDEGS